MSDSQQLTQRRKAILALGALGVVYGDIGTSPLYAFKESMTGHGGQGRLPVDPITVTGILSLLIWSLLIIISIKYVVLVMRADNKGEGGMMSLLALTVPGAAEAAGPAEKKKRGRGAGFLVVLALLGTAFLVGEGIITPAISVLSAVEGLKVVAPELESWIVPITVAVLTGLFAIQSRGTEKVGFMFGPITLVWFIALACLGIRGILLNPSVLAAFNPWYGLYFMFNHGWATAYTLGSVCLVITGGEALYADMGHFGKGPIRLAWWTVVLPALLLNYLGQGALVLHEHDVQSPVHELAPQWFRVPFVILGTAAAVIASQALISGSFSITMQAVRMGFLPRIAIQHTSENERGQIYVPLVNRVLMVGAIGLVLAFKTSTNLAAAYGLAVCLTMSITTVLFSQLALNRWHWAWWKVMPICGLFFLIEACFVGSNLLKVAHGGYVPVVIGLTLLATMLTWKRGRSVLADKFARICIPITDLLQSLSRGGAARVRGTAVFLTPNAGTAPPALLHNLKHNRVLHETTVILSIYNEQVPVVAEEDRTQAEDLGSGIWRVTAHYGFMEQPDVPAVLAACKPLGLDCKLHQVSFFLGRETIVPSSRNLPLWQAQYFALLSRSSQSAMAFFKIPPNRVVELGAQVEI